MVTKQKFIEIIAKHLPPSSSNLRLLDIGAVVGDILLEHRADIAIDIASLATQHWHYDANQYDAVVAYDTFLSAELLQATLAVMREGGRFILVNPLGSVDEMWVKALENTGYIRILVEPAYEGEGVLIRGEKAHTTDNTLERVRHVADDDANLLDFARYRGRYVHLLIIQTPNKPVWKLSADDEIKWHAVTIEKGSETHLLAFSSLPKAVSFMQPAVMQGFIQDVNKVGKFSKIVAQKWENPILLNPILSDIDRYNVRLLYINPDTAEAPDE